MTNAFRTLASEHRHEIDRIKGSRFVGTAAPISSEADAGAFFARVRDELGPASHHCFAFRLGPDGALFRSSDDGEPSGSAGRPILQQIEGHVLTDVAVVVTRWFGGTKLGVGGLMRAYGGCAGKTLDRAPTRTVMVTARLRVEHSYACSAAVQAWLAARQMVPVSADYGSLVTLELEVPLDDFDTRCRELTDATGGRATLQRLS
ncbi:MAG: YigZ family protein [Planctomycetota bacterium]